jgi:diguanylate cyclase (GGDEF)-like protein/PAS domain S-box-containing protein
LRLADTVVKTVEEGVLVTDHDNLIVAVNPAFTTITGYSAEEVLGKNPRILSSGRHGKEFYTQMWQTLSATGGWRGEISDRRKNGEIYIEGLSIKLVRDEEGRITHYVGIFSDISERKAAEARIRHMAHHDALTNLPNRSLFSDRLGQGLAQARRDKTRLAVMFLDLDKFKPVNDTYGHAVGDQLLKEVATRLQKCMRESDTVSRIGGDEFVVLLPTIEADQDAMRVAEKMLKVLSQPFEIAGHSLHISGSIGIAVFPEHGGDEISLSHCADTAMYHAKSGGHNNAKIYRPDMRDIGK